MNKKVLLIIVAIVAMMQTAVAQQNAPFKSGETLEYKMYFNWQFIWLNAGTATMTTREQNYNGKPSYRCSLVTRTSNKIDKYFRMRDTLMCNVSKDFIPLYYRKGAREGERYYVDELFYTYGNSGTTVTMKALTSKGEHKTQKHQSKYYVYDMLSIFMRARTFDPSNWKSGYTFVFPIVDASHVQNAKLRFRGRSTVKAEDGNKYKCLELSYIETEDKKEREIVRFFVTDDKRHIPVRLDLFLKFGTAKAFLTRMH